MCRGYPDLDREFRSGRLVLAFRLGLFVLNCRSCSGFGLILRSDQCDLYRDWGCRLDCLGDSLPASERRPLPSCLSWACSECLDHLCRPVGALLLCVCLPLHCLTRGQGQRSIQIWVADRLGPGVLLWGCSWLPFPELGEQVSLLEVRREVSFEVWRLLLLVWICLKSWPAAGRAGLVRGA